ATPGSPDSGPRAAASGCGSRATGTSRRERARAGSLVSGRPRPASGSGPAAAGLDPWSSAAEMVTTAAHPERVWSLLRYLVGRPVIGRESEPQPSQPRGRDPIEELDRRSAERRPFDRSQAVELLETALEGEARRPGLLAKAERAELAME